MELVELRCKNCGSTLKPENLSEHFAVARCSHCDAVFALNGAPRRPNDGVVATAPRAAVPRPRKIRVSDLGSSLEITYRWFGPQYIALLVFCVFWNGFMIFWHGMALATGAYLMSAFGLLHTAVGVGLLYFTVAGLLNRTTIRVQRGTLEVQHGPIPWPGNKTVVAHSIKQMYCRETVRHGKNARITVMR